MIHKLLLTRWPFGTFMPLRACMRSINTRRDFRQNQISLPSGAHVLKKQQMNLKFQSRYLQAIPGISQSKRHFGNHEKDKSISRKSIKFLEFHDSISCREDDFTMSHSEWENLESEILAESPNLSAGLDYSIMKTLSEKPDLSVSFLDYIKTKREPNFSVLTEFFFNCAVKYEDIVLNEYEKFRKTYDLKKLHAKTNRIAYSIAKTREWKASISLLDMDQSSSLRLPFVGLKACAEILKASLKYQDYKTFFEVWTKFIQVNEKRDLEIFSEAFYDSWREGVIPVDVFMELLKLDEMPLQGTQMIEFQRYCNSKLGNSANAQLTKVNWKSRTCYNCSEQIPECEPIDASFYEKMCQEILHKLLIGDNIFKKSNPKELENFISFMSNQEYPFDYVFDGLNMINRTRITGRSVFPIETVRNLHNSGKRVLVILKGKKKKIEESCKKWATVISFDHKTYDDCYLLLAAFLSGPECCIVTNDDFRDHIAVVDPSLRPYFLLWRDQKRIFHNFDRLMYPPAYRWTAYESESAWHIPCRKSLGQTERQSAYTFSDFQTRLFFCVRKLNYVPSAELALLKLAKADSTDKTSSTEVS